MDRRFVRQPGAAKRYFDVQTGEIISTRQRTARAKSAGLVQPKAPERAHKERTKKTEYRELLSQYQTYHRIRSKPGQKPPSKKDLATTPEFKALYSQFQKIDNTKSGQKSRKQFEKLLGREKIPKHVIERYFGKGQKSPGTFKFVNRISSRNVA